MVNGGTTTTVTWDAEERLKTVAVGGVTTQTNTYNGIGQRVKKVEGSNTFNFTVNDDAVDSDILSDGAASYMQGAGGLIGETRGRVSEYYHTDALGTTRAMTNSSASVTDTKETDAFGLNVAVTGTTPTPFGFAGQSGYQSDSVTGLMRLGHRYYDASVGRFISRDPIRDGYNWYGYAGNDPVNKVDPTGRQMYPFGSNKSVDAILIGIGVVLIVVGVGGLVGGIVTPFKPIIAPAVVLIGGGALVFWIGLNVWEGRSPL